MQLATPDIAQKLARYPERTQHIIEEMCQVTRQTWSLRLLSAVARACTHGKVQLNFLNSIQVFEYSSVFGCVGNVKTTRVIQFIDRIVSKITKISHLSSYFNVFIFYITG